MGGGDKDNARKTKAGSPASFLSTRGVVGARILVGANALVLVGASALVLVGLGQLGLRQLGWGHLGLGHLGLGHLGLEIVDALGRVRVGLGFAAADVQIGGGRIGDGGHGGRRGGADIVHGDVEQTDDHDEAADHDVEPLPGEGQDAYANVDWGGTLYGRHFGALEEWFIFLCGYAPQYG